MKFTVLLVLLLVATFLVIGFANKSYAADVKNVDNIGPNGTSEGDAYRITCSTGIRTVIERREGKWHQGAVKNMVENIPASTSPEEVAKKLCSKL